MTRNVLRQVVGSRPVVLAVAKVDRMPRLDESHLSFLEGRFARKLERKGGVVGSYAVSALTGAGLPELAQRVMKHPGDVLLFGTLGSGKSELVRALSAWVGASRDASYNGT